jgi:geranylgeranyl pyrophosphate synthase
MHELKTGALIRASVALGAMAFKDVTQQQLDRLDSYAHSIGLAFQVQDDVLDVTADTETLGKPQGADIALNKPTYPALMGLQQAQQKAYDLIELAHQ